jgi:membrane protein DedA with SNARE-associated domain
MKPLPLLAAAVVAGYLLRRRDRVGRVGLVGGLLAIVALCGYGTGLVKPPALDDALADLGQRLGAWTYVLVGVLVFLESGALVGLVSPGETVVILGGVIAGQGEISIAGLIALTWACAFAGDLTGYALGRRAGREVVLRHGKAVKLTPERLEQVERLLHRHGTKLLLPGRFLGAVRALAPVVAGVTRMPAARFAVIELVASGVWSTAFSLLGYFFWDSFDQAAKLAKNASLALTAVILGGIAIAIIIRKLRSKRFRHPAHTSKDA